MASAAHTLKTPFKWVGSVATPEEIALQKADIKVHGITDPILIDSDENILDGHKRYEIDPKTRTQVLAGSDKMTEGEKEAYVANRRDGRARTPTPQETLKKIALKLKHEGKTQAEVGKIMGKSRTLITAWLGELSNVSPDNAQSPPPDNRRKLSDEDKAAILELVRKGQTQKAIADQYHIHPTTVSNIVRQSRRASSNGENESPAKPLGKITKHDPLSVRVMAAKADVASGKKVKDVCSRYALSQSDYKRGSCIVDRNHVPLTKAVDDQVITLNSGYELSKLTDDKIDTSLLLAREKAAAKRGKARSSKSTTTTQKVSELIGSTYDTWAAFKQNVSLKTGCIPERDRALLRTKCGSVRLIVTEVLDSIERRL